MHISMSTKFDLGERIIIGDREVAQVKAVHLEVRPGGDTRVKYQIETSDGKVHILPEEEVSKVGEYLESPGERYAAVGVAQGWLLN